jgi:probable HAF family extracellular repeat protein
MKRVLLLALLIIIFTAQTVSSKMIFEQTQQFTIGSEPSSIAIADLNGDGRNDVVVTTIRSAYDPANDNKIFIFYQDSNGNLQSPIVYNGGNGLSLAIGDVNNDGRPDIIVDTDSGIGVLYQKADRTFASMQIIPGPRPTLIKVIDINHDGLLDIVAVNYAWNPAGKLSFYLQQSNGTLALPILHLPISDDEIALADVNNDGLIDAIVSSDALYQRPFRIYHQMPDGSFSDPIEFISPVSGWTPCISVGDINNDGLNEIGYCNNTGVGFFRQNGNNGFLQLSSYPTLPNPEAIIIADMNNDGRSDLVVAHDNSHTSIGVYFQNTDGSLDNEQLFGVFGVSLHPFSPERSIAVGDLNNDGLKDLAVLDPYQGLLVVLRQADITCNYSINPNPLTINSIGSQSGYTGVKVTVNDSRCPWVPVSNQSWISLYSLDQSILSGNGTFGILISSNTSELPRTGSVTIENQTLTVNQAGCNYTLSSSYPNFDSAGGGGTISVTNDSSECQWTASSNAPWLSVSPSSGSGSKTLSFTVAPNTDLANRNAIITIGGKTITVNQSGLNCTYALSPASQTVSPDGTSTAENTINITTQEGCNWVATTAATEWISMSTSKGSGSGQIKFWVFTYTGTSPRTATISSEGQTATVTQDPCIFSLPYTRDNFYKAGGAGTARVVSNGYCGWTATSTVPWITINSESASGTGNGFLDFTVSANTGATDRTGTLVMGGQTFLVTQYANNGPGGELIDLGTLGGAASNATKVTPDGSAVIGTSTDSNGNFRAFRWTKATGMVNLGSLGGTESGPHHVSLDGGTVVGVATDISGIYHAFRWTEETGMVDLGSLGGTNTSITAMTADGNVVVGMQMDVSGIYHAVRWIRIDTSSGGSEMQLVDLGTLDGNTTAAFNVSADGNVVAGNAYKKDSYSYMYYRSFRWTQASGMIDLGVLGDPSAITYIGAMSSDGSVIVGSSYDQNYFSGRPFRWTQAAGMTDLGNPGITAWALNLSSDGSIVIGSVVFSGANWNAFRWTKEMGMLDLGNLKGWPTSAYAMSLDCGVIIGNAGGCNHNSPYGDCTYLAFRWSQSTGIQSIGQWLAGAGINAGSLEFSNANASSANGNTIVGQLSNNHAFLARVETTCGDKLVKLGGASPYYTAIQSAYNSASNGQPLLIRASNFTENLLLQGNSQVMLQGGYNCDFSSNPGLTTLTGSLTITGGPVTIENLLIK